MKKTIRSFIIAVGTALFSGPLFALAQLQNVSVMPASAMGGMDITVSFQVQGTAGNLNFAIAIGQDAAFTTANVTKYNWLADDNGIYKNQPFYWYGGTSETAAPLPVCDVTGPLTGLPAGVGIGWKDISVITHIPPEFTGQYYIYVLAKENANLAAGCSFVPNQDAAQAVPVMVLGIPQYKFDLKLSNSGTVANRVNMRYQITNNGEAGVPLNNFKFGYWFNDSAVSFITQTVNPFYVFLPGGTELCSNGNTTADSSVTSLGTTVGCAPSIGNNLFTYTLMNTAPNSSNAFLIPPGGGYINCGSSTSIYFSRSDMANMDYTDDYTRVDNIPSYPVFTDVQQAVLYYNNVIVQEWINSSTVDPLSGLAPVPCTPTMTMTPTQTPTITMTPNYFVLGNREVIDTSSGLYLNSTMAKESMRFTQGANNTVSKIYVAAAGIGTAPVTRIGIQADDGSGRPNGAYLTSATFTAAAYQVYGISVPPFTLAPGIYHIVVQWESGTVDAGDYTYIYGDTPFGQIIPVDQSIDPAMGLLSYIGMWAQNMSITPVFVVEYSDSTQYGNPFDSAIQGSVYGTNYYSQYFTPSSNLVVNRVGTYLYKYNSPTGDLNFVLYNDTAKVTVTAGTFAASAQVTSGMGNQAWVFADLGGNFSLYSGQNYRLIFYSPGSNSSNYYVIIADSAFNSATWGITYAGLASYMAFSSDGGYTYSPQNGTDLAFQFLNNPVVGSRTPTPTYTAVQTATATPTLTPAVLSFVMRQERSANGCAGCSDDITYNINYAVVPAPGNVSGPIYSPAATKLVGAGQAYLTISSAMASAVPGDVIEVEDSRIYGERIIFPDTSNTQGIILRAKPGARPIILPPAALSGDNGIVEIGYNDAISGFIIDGRKIVDEGITMQWGMAGLTIDRCVVMNCNSAGVYFDTMGAAALSTYPSTYITNCVFEYNNNSGWGFGIEPDQGTTRAGMELYIWNCTFNANAGSIDINESAYPYDIRNCILWGEATYIYSGDKSKVSYSIIDDSSPAGYGTGCSISNPLFVNAAAGIYQLMSGSPAINTGDSSVSSVVTYDMNFSPRPAQGLYDKGAFEFNPSNCTSMLSNISIWDTIPSGMGFVSASAGFVQNAGVVSWLMPSACLYDFSGYKQLVLSPIAACPVTSTALFENDVEANYSGNLTPVAGNPVLLALCTAAVTPTFTWTATPTVTATVTGTMTSSCTQTITSTVTPSATQTVTGTTTQTVSNTCIQTVTQTETPSVTRTITKTTTPTYTPTVTGTYSTTVSPTLTQTVTATCTETATPTTTKSATPTVTDTASPTLTFTETGTATPTVTATGTETFTDTGTATQTATPSATDTFTASPTFTVSPTITESATGTDTATPTSTFTCTPTATGTFTQTFTETATQSATFTFTWTITPTWTITQTPTATPEPDENNVLDKNYVDASKGETVNIKVNAAAAGLPVNVKVYGMTGELIRKLSSVSYAAGWNDIIWDVKNESGKIVGQGLYFIEIESQGMKKLRRIYVLK